VGRTEREFSERDRDVLDIAGPVLEGALRATQARGRLVHALAADPPPGTAVVLLNRDGEIELSSRDADRWFAEHFDAAAHPGWLPGSVAEWLALPPRPRWSASAKAAASPSAWCPAIRTRCWSRSRSPASAPTRSTGSA
jgi:hypothetical protein